MVIEGAGAKMPFELAQIEYIEMNLKKPISSIMDLAVTTSAGSVLMGALSLGKIYARELSHILLGDRDETDKKTSSLLKKIFKGTLLPRIPKYSRSEYIDYFNSKFGENVLMKEALLNLVMTSVNECENKTHFFKSWEDSDGGRSMTNSCCRSFAAPYFFGEMIDEKTESIWTDGGIGIFNLPLIQAYAQARKNGWLGPWHQTHILAIGGGSSNQSVDYNSFIKKSFFGSLKRLGKSLKYFFNLEEGGAARAGSTQAQVDWLKFTSSSYDNLTFQFVNWDNMPKKLDQMGNWKARWDYYDKGMEMAKTIDLEALK